MNAQQKSLDFLESRRKYWDYSVISLCVYGNPGYNTVLFTWTRTKALDTMGY